MGASYMVMLSGTELIIAGIVLVVIILAVILGIVFGSRRRKQELELAEEEADFYCDLYYKQVLKEAEMKYKAYVARSYQDKLPNPVEAIGKNRQMEELLDQTDDLVQRRTVLEDYLPGIMLAMVRCKAENLIDSMPKKEATQMRRLMKDYDIAL